MDLTVLRLVCTSAIWVTQRSTHRRDVGAVRGGTDQQLSVRRRDICIIAMSCDADRYPGLARGHERMHATRRPSRRLPLRTVASTDSAARVDAYYPYAPIHQLTS